MKRLFDDTDRYTPAANDMDQQMSELIRPIVEQAIKNGYSLRDVAYVMTAAVSDAILMGILGRDVTDAH